ncbi:MAG: EAL domain-containing protein [Marinobacter sp.]|nr:EAL domain-containing protein [Marinobacter sp.]
MPSLPESHYRAAFDQLPHAMMLATDEPRIMYINEMFRRVTGYHEGDVIGHRPSVLSSGVHPPEFYRDMWASLTSKGHWEGVIWNRRKSGETYPQWLSIYPVQTGEGRFYAGVFSDVGENRVSNESITALAYYDPLTGLANRSLFQEFLKARVTQGARSESRFAVLFIDLDFFKGVNDLHGHACGDRILVHMAATLRSVLREGDIVARLSGDEFAAIVNAGTSEELEHLLRRIFQALTSPVVIEGREFFLSVSVGAALFPGHGQTAAELLQNSDRAMFSAKQAGRGCARIYSAAESKEGMRTQRLTEALQGSLKLSPEEFSVVYQPQYDLQSGTMTGMEALLRWTHPVLGDVPPGEFVPMAEQRGLIHELTGVLIRRVLTDLQTLSSDNVGPMVLAINISARQITDGRLADLLAPFIRETRQRGWQPEIEITETHLMNLAPLCLQRLEEFGRQGVRVAIDDFGTGYSSLAYLHNLPVHVLKIDRQFVSRLQEGCRDSRIVTAIVAIAEAMQLEVVAEGIEDELQRRILREMRCHRGQGFFLARPSSWATITDHFLDVGQLK